MEHQAKLTSLIQTRKRKLIIEEILIKIAVKNLNDYLDFHSKIIHLWKRNKQNWGLHFFDKIIS